MFVDFNLEEEEWKRKEKTLFQTKMNLATCLHYFNCIVNWMYLNLLLINRELWHELLCVFGAAA